MPTMRWHGREAGLGIRISFAVLLGLATTICGPGAASDQKSVDSSEKTQLNLRLITAKQLNVQEPIIGTGTVFAHKSSKIGPTVEGQLVAVHVKVGDHVKLNEPLFQIRPDNYRLMFEEARARLAMARAKLTDAQPAYERAKSLHRRGTTSRALLDKASSALAVVRSEIELAAVVVKRANRDLEDTVVRAPFKGVITSRYKDEGVYLSPRIPGSNSAVIDIQKIDIVVVIIQVPARFLDRLFIGARARIKIDGLTAPIEAKVNVINHKVDIATRSAEVRIAIPNKGYKIRPGLFARAAIFPKPRKVVVVPRNIVRGNSGQRFVFLYQNRHAVRKEVEVVDYSATLVEVVSGLKEGVHILSGPDLLRVTDGLDVGGVPNVAG